MSRAQTLLALAAVVLASVSAMNVGGRPRPIFALGAILLLALLGYWRVRETLAAKKPRRSFDAYDRALRIQELRDEKHRR